MLFTNEHSDLKVYVSLTSIFQKQDSLVQTLESIKSQKYQIDKCYIYLSEESYLIDEGFAEKKITNNNLKKFLDINSDIFEVVWTENIGSYRKLIPLLKAKMKENCIIITVDDDSTYDPNMINNYLDEFFIHDCCIAGRCYTMSFDNISKVTYDQSQKEIPKYLYNFHTGKGGVLYHPKFFSKTKKHIVNKKLFESNCKTADDVWFNFHRIANKIECKITKNYCIKDLTQNHSLFMNINHHIDKNTGESYNTNAMRSVVKTLFELGYKL